MIVRQECYFHPWDADVCKQVSEADGMPVAGKSKNTKTMGSTFRSRTWTASAKASQVLRDQVL